MKYKVQEKFKFDPTKMPADTKEVMFLKGSWYEMGLQYGINAMEAVHMIAASKISIAKRGFGSVDKAIEYIMENYMPVYEKDAPMLLDFWKGVSEGSGLSYETIVLSATVFNDEDFGCSTMSAWGRATEGGKVLAGVNMDEPGYTACYDYVIVAYPDEGNNFITNRGFLQNLNMIMNDKGVVAMNSAGQNQLEEDTGFGIPNAKAGMIAAWKAGTAEEARDEYMARGAGNGENCNIVDVNGHGYLVEHNARINVVRTAGQFGETDFLLNCNGELTPEMQPSIYQGEYVFDDSLPRYWAEEKILKDNLGSITKDVMAQALGCTSVYIEEKYLELIRSGGEIPGWMPIENGIYLDKAWDLEEGICGWTPENRGPGWKSLIRSICDPVTKEFFVMAGPADPLAAPQADPTSNFWRITLEESPEKVNDEVRTYAQSMMFLACRDMDLGNARDDKERFRKLTEAKKALFEGINYQLLADAADDEIEYLGLVSKSTSAFCRCQCFAQAAQDDPTKIDREQFASIDSNFIGA